MPTSIRVDPTFQSQQSASRRSLTDALENRRSYVGFALGMAATLVITLSALGYALVTWGS